MLKVLRCFEAKDILMKSYLMVVVKFEGLTLYSIVVTYVAPFTNMD